jgi:hypothetical protein
MGLGNEDCQLDVRLGTDLRYTEALVTGDHGTRSRRCCLWRDGVAEDVSQASLLSFDIRFGAVAVAAEGYAAVQTRVEHRRQGYVRQVMTESLRRASERVDVVFLFGISGLYRKFGFVNCLADTHLEVPVRMVEAVKPVRGANVRAAGDADVPAIVDLYNSTHAVRPWTWQRRPGEWRRLLEWSIWRPGSEAVILEMEDEVAGYMITRGVNYGQTPGIEVQELAARSAKGCQALLAAAGEKCWESRLSSFALHEPSDSLVGRVARQVGCREVSSWKPDGGGMGVILNRQALVEQLAPELERRAAVLGRPKGEQRIDALASGEICPDDGVLVRLLLGHWSWADAEAAGYDLGNAPEALVRTWFCGGGTQALPQPYAHPLDHY